MKRREFLSVVSGAVVIPLTLPPVAGAQQGERVRVVGLLTPSDAEGRRRALLQGLEKLGYREGQNIALEVRSADGKLERLPSLASELVRTPSSSHSKHPVPRLPSTPRQEFQL